MGKPASPRRVIRGTGGGGKIPLIGLTSDAESTGQSSGFAQERFVIKKAYFDAVIASGGAPLLIPAYAEAARTDHYLSMIDGLIITGGHFDVDPSLYGEKAEFRIDEIKPERTLMEIRLIKKAVRMGMPALGVCGGMQAINVAFGGSLYQDIPSQIPHALRHEQSPIPSHEATHEVAVTPGGVFAQAAGARRIMVNSTHHQGVKTLGKRLEPCAVSADGLVEAIEGTFKSFLVGVQWHPELLYGQAPESARLFKSFIKACRDFGKKRKGR
jgi:putative glutamine amidotransferase